MTIINRLDIEEEIDRDYGLERIWHVSGYLRYVLDGSDLEVFLDEGNIREDAISEAYKYVGSCVHIPESAVSISARIEGSQVIVDAEFDADECEYSWVEAA